MTAKTQGAAAPTQTSSSPVAVKAATYAEGATITCLVDNPKRGASKERFAGYGPKGGTTTVKEYLDHCAKVQPDEPRGRWRADLAWDVKHGFISIA